MSWRKIKAVGAPRAARPPTLSRHRDAVEVLGRGGIARVHRLERLDDDPAHRPVAEPLAVAGDDVPRRVLGRGVRDRLLVGGLVVVPALALGEVAGIELPALRGVVEAGLQPLRLLLARDVQEELDDARAGVLEQRLEVVDVAVAPAPGRLVDEAVHARDEDVLVVRAVEDRDLAAARRAGVDAPEEVVVELHLARDLERGDADALRVHPGEHVLDRPVLAAGVHGLQDDEQRPRRLGVEAILEPAEVLGEVAERLLRRLLAPRRAVGGGGVAARERERAAGRHDEAVAVGRAHRATQASPWRSRWRYSAPCSVTMRNTAWASSVPGRSTTCTSSSSRISAGERSANAARHASSSSERSQPRSCARASASAWLAASSSALLDASSERARRPLATKPPTTSAATRRTTTTMTISSVVT